MDRRPEIEEDVDFGDDDGPARPGDTIIDFSTDPPTVYTVPDPDDPTTEGSADLVEPEDEASLRV